MSNVLAGTRRAFLGCAAVVVVLGAACKKDPPASPPAPPPARVDVAAPSPAAPQGTPVATTPDKKVMPPNFGAPPEAAGGPLGLGPRLGMEQRSRPTQTPRAEVVLDAIEKAGIPIGKRQQYLAVVVGAKYCLGGNTPSRLAVSVCEYGSDEGATRGRELAMARFKAVEKVIHVNRKTTLTLSRMGALPASEGEAKRIADLFATLTP